MQLHDEVPALVSPERVADEWFGDFHHGLAARFWRVVGAAMADADIKLVEQLLALPAGGSVLDLPCGDGRLAIRLAAAGHEVTGADISAPEIEYAEQVAAAAGVDVRFLVADMRELPELGQFDGVLSWGNAFGYAPAADTAESLVRMHRALKPGGHLVLESAMVAESFLAGDVETTTEHEFGGIRMTGEHYYRVAESRLESTLVLEDADGHIETTRAAHHVHTAGEVVRMLRAAGFGEVTLVDGDGEPYAIGARRFIAVAVA